MSAIEMTATTQYAVQDNPYEYLQNVYESNKPCASVRRVFKYLKNSDQATKVALKAILHLGEKGAKGLFIGGSIGMGLGIVTLSPTPGAQPTAALLLPIFSGIGLVLGLISGMVTLETPNDFHEIIRKTYGKEIYDEFIKQHQEDPLLRQQGFVCPLSNKLLLDPVTITPCGHTFNRKECEKALKANGNHCPDAECGRLVGKEDLKKDFRLIRRMKTVYIGLLMDEADEHEFSSEMKKACGVLIGLLEAECDKEYKKIANKVTLDLQTGIINREEYKRHLQEAEDLLFGDI